jgi:hypothetical protein
VAAKALNGVMKAASGESGIENNNGGSGAKWRRNERWQ